MAFIPTPNCAVYEIRGLLDGQQVEMTVSVDHAASPTITQMQEMADAIATWCTGALLPSLSSDLEIRSVFGTSQVSDIAPTVVSTETLPALGGTSGGSMPNNVSICVSLRTNQRGRQSRGRNYVPGIPKSAVTVGNNRVSTAFMTALQNDWNALGEVITTAGGVHVVISRFDGVNPVTGKPIPKSSGTITPIVAYIIVDNVLDSQRKRLPGRGR